MLPSVSLASGCQGAPEWVDLDTPSHACTTSGKGNQPFKLVFSDEFELAGRSFKDGDDARWTGIDSWPGGNAQVSYYNGSLPITHEGRLHMPVVKHLVPPRKDDNGNYLMGTEKYYQTAMIQTWNKFCFSQSGIVEMKARLPGKATMPGLWPAFWIMGNLGRATLEDSTDGIWPFSYDECVDGSSEDCETSQCHSQRISACDDTPGHGLNPNQGRGSPEVDILEAMPGDPKTTGAHNVFHCKPADGNASPLLQDKDMMGYLQMPRPQLIGSYQVAPGMPRGALERPKDACLPLEGEWYKWNLSKHTQRFWYDGASPPDPGVVVMPTYEFFGSNLTKDPDRMGQSSMEGGLTDSGGITGLEGGGDHPMWVQTDSLSATTPLRAEQWAEQHVYSIEWRHTKQGDGYMRWMMDGIMYFELPETLLSTSRRMHFNHRRGGEMKGRMLPVEPMYLILNVDMSPNWGWPEWHRCGLGECECCMDCTNPKCTTCMVHTNFTTPRNDVIPGGKEKLINAFAWFADMCKKIPSLDDHPHMGVDTGLLDLSYQIEYVRVYQPEEAIDVGCDPAGFPTAEWIDDHEQDFRPHGMEKPIKSVVPGGGACSEDRDCAGAVTPGVRSPRGSCANRVHGDPGTCVCADGWVGPHCMSQSAGIAAQCALFEESHMRAEAQYRAEDSSSRSPRCHPPSDYNRTMLQHVIDALCTADFKADDGSIVKGTRYTDTAQTALNKTCNAVATRGGMHFSCSEPAKAAALTAALSDASGRCCNAVTFGTKNGKPTRSLMCRGVDAPDSPAEEEAQPPTPGSGWLSIIGGGAILGGFVGIAMCVKQRWLDARRGGLAPASDDYHAMPSANEGL
jgi:hypothetical protein